MNDPRDPLVGLKISAAFSYWMTAVENWAGTNFPFSVALFDSRVCDRLAVAIGKSFKAYFISYVISRMMWIN